MRVRVGTTTGTPLVESDPIRVRQVIFNLLANAIKFTPGGRESRVEVGPLADAERVLVAVRDEGPGIAAEDRERISEPYQQVSGVARGRGTGLGLPLSRRLARLMGGELWVESEVGHGSSFFLRLPLLLPLGGVLQAGGDPPS